MPVQDAVPGTKLCPNCGNVLRAEGASEPRAAGGQLQRELLFWGALALVLGYLWTASGTGERIGGAGAIILLVWLLRRSRQRAAGQTLGEPGRYHCDYCQGRFEGEELREVSPRRASSEW